MSDHHESPILQSDASSSQGYPQRLFIFPITEDVIFPGLVTPISIPAGKQAENLKHAQEFGDHLGFIFSTEDEVSSQDHSPLASVGTLTKVLQATFNGDGGYNLLLANVKRFKVIRYLESERLIAEVEYLEEDESDSEELQALWRGIQGSIAELLKINPQVPEDLIREILTADTPRTLANMISTHFPIPLPEKQKLLEENSIHDRLMSIYTHLVREMDLVRLAQRIQEKIQAQMEENQREFFLREQLKAIRRELGEERDEKGLNIELFEKRIAESGMPEEPLERAKGQLKRLRLLTPDAAEYNMIRTYLEWLIDVPWSAQSEDNLDLIHAEKVLNDHHYGLDDVKERIIEFLAVKKLKPDQKGQIICFLGPPGVGKTSLGKSITKALGRKFFRFSLGGTRDEAEIKGHRRTYIGAMPGKIIQGLKRVATRNPVFVLDEIDKLGSDGRGDPSSAMLEVLDPEQNHAFLDHYLDVPFDLSHVMFIATANTTSTIPQALLDRMEIIELSGYIEQEKIEIARRHLVPQQREKHGLSRKQFGVTVGALRKIVLEYTREAGVRNLNRLIAKLCRKIAVRIVRNEITTSKIKLNDVEEFLGAPPFIDEMISRGHSPGIAVGLAWTRFGGEILFIEATQMVGRGNLKLTGKLGEVMSESVQIAFSYVKANARQLKLDVEVFKKHDFHVHFPAGAVPKDGPSAGITIVSAILSLLRQRPIPPRLAMTGEITLVGNILPVGGIKEKIIAARRAGAKQIILPAQNKKDLAEVPDYVSKGLQFHFASTYKDVARVVFAAQPPANAKKPSRRKRTKGKKPANSSASTKLKKK